MIIKSIKLPKKKPNSLLKKTFAIGIKNEKIIIKATEHKLIQKNRLEKSPLFIKFIRSKQPLL